MKTTADTEARVYVGTYSKYNDGNLGGKWLDLGDYADRDEFLTACRELHKDESDPELMFQDYEGFPAHFYGESEISADLWDWLAMDESDRKLLDRYCDACGDRDATIEDARDHYAGTYASGADAAEQIAEDTGAVPKDFPSWIVVDWEATWNCNLRHDYSTSEDDEGLWLFTC